MQCCHPENVLHNRETEAYRRNSVMSPWGGQSLSIYGYVLSTGSVDEAANTWIITIDERRHLRRRTTLHRQNDYQMGTLNPSSLASRELASLLEWKSWNASKRRSRSDLQTLFEFARFVGAYRPINHVLEIGARSLPVLRRCANV